MHLSRWSSETSLQFQNNNFMVNTFGNIVLAGATLCNGLMAGLLFAYSCSVVPGFKTMSAIEYIRAMQAINKAIQNPLFFLVFVGCLILLPLCSYLSYSSPPSSKFWLVLAATVIYFAGVFATTALGNIPLNNALEKFNLAAASKEAINNQRLAFEARWNTFHYIRTTASVVSLVLMIVACINFRNNN